ncbi:MAG: inositol monophosphatase, partial [Chloroflexota bacterium]|nr:inositol monophosphatase [Chloroflexota bacterium]
HKGAIDLVTDVDRAAEDLIAERLRAAFPDHQLVGEEGARGATGTSNASAYRWVIDPLDGTTNYAHGYPHFAVSIGLEYAGTPLLGAIYDPLLDELFVAGAGRGATLNGRRLAVSDTRALIDSLLATGFPYDLERRGRSNALWEAFNERSQGVRRAGSAALSLCYVAAGRLDGYWERPIRPWDMAAGALIVVEAGGQISRLAGEPFAIDGGEIVASNRLLHPAILEIIGERT